MTRSTQNSAEQPVLSVRDLSVTYPGRRGATTPVRGVSLDIKAGEILGLVGESGAGKSLTGLSVMGLLEPPGYVSAGEIHLLGRRIDGLSKKQMRQVRGRDVGMIFQDPLTSLNPLYRILDQLTETIQAHATMTNAQARERAYELLDDVGLPDARVRANGYPHELSGGMRQRVVIALALAGDPQLLIADEPTTALDVSTQAQIIDLIRRLTEDRGLAVLFVSHDLGVIAQLSARVAVMRAGEIVEIGPTDQVIRAPVHSYTRDLMSSIPPLNRKVARLRRVGGEVSEDAESHEFAAREIGTELRVDVAHLSKHFDLSKPWLTRKLAGEEKNILKAVDDVSFGIRFGETLAIVGESGSGKSTVARVIAGLADPTDGEVKFSASAKQSDSTGGGLQMIFQDPYASLNPRWSVGAIIAEPVRRFGLRPNQSDITDRVHELLEFVGLTAADALRYPHEFSGGQRQRISIARALAAEPDFLICDEPTSALDVSVQAQVLNLMKDLQDELGLTYLFISHDLSVVRFMADRIGVMQHGKLVELQETEALFDAPEADYTSALLAAVPRI